ncbi:hypothetical protein KJ068_27845 [bacterium]|nr:hypothetical protein [bacterium]
MKTRLMVLLSILFCLAVSPGSHAQIPRTLSYQGVLTDNAGKPRPDGSYNFTFRFYTSHTGGAPIWSESRSLSTKNGLFSTALGEQTSFGAAVKFDTQYWLGIQVGSDPELSPRIALTSVGYSFSSLRADTASVSVASLADTTWRHSGANIYRSNGNVGIGTANPISQLAIAMTNKTGVESDLIVGQITASPMVGIHHVREDDNQSFSALTFKTTTGNTYTEKMRITHDGRIGIGTANPISLLTVGVTNKTGVESDLIVGQITASPMVGIHHVREDDNQSFSALTFKTTTGNTYTEKMRITHDGRIGIGTANPISLLTVGVTNKTGVESDLIVGQITASPMVGVHHVREDDNQGFSALTFKTTTGNAYTEKMRITHDGSIGIGTTSPTSKLEVVGTTTTKVLEITGGGDLAEPFEISETQPIPQGALVIIDEENPGQLKLSHQAYDKRVAGVVSGAGGINPGITLTQEGMLEGGQNVALAGRVYALATAANGPIRPGDLLTTSEVPGHAMKATDRELWPGAVIGKAMSKLESGEGLVLVLVNLQ